MLMRFLIIRLSSIGDIVHALPAASALARTFPESEVHWVAEARSVALFGGNPLVHRVIQFDTLGWRRSLASGSQFQVFCKETKQRSGNPKAQSMAAWKSFQPVPRGQHAQQ